MRWPGRCPEFGLDWIASDSRYLRISDVQFWCKKPDRPSELGFLRRAEVFTAKVVCRTDLLLPSNGLPKLPGV